MGTRSLTRVYDGFDPKAKPIVCLYRQYDGYPEGAGKDLAEFLRPFTIVNGLGRDTAKVANGMHCLAAQLVAHFKTEPGGFYLYEPDTTDCGEEFEYRIRGEAGKPIQIEAVEVVGNEKYELVFKGTPDEFLAFIAKSADASV